MNNRDNSSKQKGFEINIVAYLLELSKKLWLLVIVALVFGMLGGIAGKFLSKDVYSSDISFIVNTIDDGKYAENSAVSAQINMSQTFKVILSSRAMFFTVQEASDNKLDYNIISNSIYVSVVSGTNVIKLEVRTENPETSYQIAKLIVENYGDVVERAYPNAMLTVCDVPVKATVPNSNRTVPISVAVTAIVAFVVFCIVELVKFVIRDTVKSADELSEKLDLPILGAVQFVENKNKTSKGLLVVDRKTGFSFIETYKAIRTKIENNSARTGNKVYLVTSACENEGKTTVSTNIALSLAENGKRVLLIDADLRNPTISKILAIPEIDVGFIDVIRGEAKLENAIKLIKSFNLYLLADQKAASNPSELLSMKITEDIVRGLRDDFDYIIIDTAPASVVTDTSVIAGFSDAAIMVVRENFSPFSRIRMSVEDIDQNGSEIVGCVFNGDTNASIKTRKYGKYGKYGYGKYGYGKYGYGYGYGSNSNKK